MTPHPSRAWDLKVAEMVAYCQKHGLTMHVSLNGGVRFEKKRPRAKR